MNKDKQMKLRNLLITLGLTLTVGAGVAVATSAKQNEEPKAAEAAATALSFYVAVDTSYTPKVWYNAGYDTSGVLELTKNLGSTYQGVQLYTANVQWVDDWHFDNLEIQLFDGGTYKGAQKIITSWSKFNSANAGRIYIYSSGTWANYRVDTYRIKCGTGSYYTMNYDDGGSLPSGLKGQYSATLDIAAGSSLTIEKNTTGSWSAISPTYSGDGNNYWEGAVCIDVSSAKIWLKFSTSGTFDVWVPGYTSCTVIVGGIQYTTATNGDNEDTALIYIDKNQTVTVSWAHIAISTYLNAGSTANCFSGSDGTVTCLLTGAYVVHVCYNEWRSAQDNVWIVRNDVSTANYLAQKFNSLVGGTCRSDGSTNTGTLKTAWDNAAGHFTNQPTDITNKFVKNSSDSDIRIMMGATGVDGKYQYVIHKYGTSVASDFLGTGDTKQAHSFMPLAMIGNDNSILIIVAISALGILSVGAYFFFRKSKKSEE